MEPCKKSHEAPLHQRPFHGLRPSFACGLSRFPHQVGLDPHPMTSLALILPILLIFVGLVLIVRTLVWFTDILFCIKERPGLYPPTKWMMYALTILGMATMVVVGGGLIKLFWAIVP